MYICLFHKTNSRYQRILWLLEELQLDYEVIFCDANIPTQKLVPLQSNDPPTKFPTVQIFHNDLTEVMTLSETAAIADYLSHQLNALGLSLLSGQEAHLYFYWKNFDEATFMPEQEQSTALFLLRHSLG